MNRFEELLKKLDEAEEIGCYSCPASKLSGEAADAIRELREERDDLWADIEREWM